MTEETTGTTSDAVESGADPIDDALAEFDKSASKPKPEPKTETETEPDLKAELQFLREEREARQAERVQKDLSETVKKVKGDSDIDDDFVEGWLDAKARKDPRVREAWLKRAENPAAFDKVLEGLSTEFSEKIKPKIDREATDTEESVRAAVRSASTKTTEGKPLTREEWRKLPPEEKRKLQADHGVTPV